MIPNKLFIPTSTLNFNNIMSSESISPAGFYSVRGFGYKRFEKTEPNNLDNRIMLYENYPIFNINDDELENYPMIIEIDTKTIKEDIIQEHQNGVFYSEETIYFNPFSTKFYFRNDNEKRSTLSKAEPSIESKMIVLYQNCFEIQPQNIEKFNWKKTDIKDINSNPSHISKDRRINKLKGFLYAYILASNKSIPAEVVTLKKYAKDLWNTLSAVIASSEGQPTYKQQEQLNVIYKAINDTFCKAEGLDKKIQKIRDEFFKEGKFEEFLTNFGNTWLPKPSFQLSPFFVSSKADADEKEKALEQHISNLEIAISRFSNPKLIQKPQVPVLQHCNKIELIPEQNKFLPKLLNEYLEEAYNSDDFLQSRYEFAKSGGKIFKEQIQNDWDGSEYQMYINTLLRNLNEHSQFEINSTENPTLKSFAAFCQKGESDIDKLEDYLISNKIGDFRIAFALWGTVFGFANMPKTLTNDLFFSNNSDYISEVYKYIFKQIHDIDLSGTFEGKQEKNFVTTSSKMNEHPKIKDKKETTTQQQASEIEIEYREKLKQVPKITKSQIDSVVEILVTNHFLIDKSLDIVSKIKGLGKTSKIFKAIKECLQPKQQKIIQTQESTLPFFNSTGNFLSDFDFLSSNYDFISIVSQHKDWKKDLKWFIDEYNNPNSQYYKGKSRENKEVIKKFIFLKKEKYKKTEALLLKIYS